MILSALVVKRAGFVRSYATKVPSATLHQFLQDPVKIIVIPVTNKKVFIYHKHTADVLNENSSVIRLERWVTKKAGDIWSKLNVSPRSYNKKIVSWVNKLLINTPWSENSLKTIPGENYLLKRVSKKDQPDQESKLSVKEYLSSKIPLEPKPLNVYFPGSIFTEEAVRSQFQAAYRSGIQYHKKQMLLCLLGLPLTLPVILVPIIPNVPGFYLTYRAYCNFKAYAGAKHLQTIIEKQSPKLEFRDIEAYDKIFTTTHETLLLNQETLPKIIDLLQIPEMKIDLEKVIIQEEARLGKGASSQ